MFISTDPVVKEISCFSKFFFFYLHTFDIFCVVQMRRFLHLKKV